MSFLIQYFPYGFNSRLVFKNILLCLVPNTFCVYTFLVSALDSLYSIFLEVALVFLTIVKLDGRQKLPEFSSSSSLNTNNSPYILGRSTIKLQIGRAHV